MARSLNDVIEASKNKIPDLRREGNEKATQTGIIQPLLQALGWDIFDHRQFLPEYPVGLHNPGRVDFVLMLGKKPLVFIETKPISSELTEGHRNQLQDYCKRGDIQFGVLTNGRIWEIFYFSKSSNQLRLIVDLEFHESIAIEEKLQKTLKREFVLNGTAVETLKQHYLVNSYQEYLPKMLANDMGIRKKFRSGIIKEHGVTPSMSDVENFLSRVKLLFDSSTQAGKKILPKTKDKDKPKSTKKYIEFELFGENEKVKSWREFKKIFLKILIEKKNVNENMLLSLGKNPPKKTLFHRFNKIEEASEFLEDPYEVLSGVWTDCNASAKNTVSVCREILSGLEYSKYELKIQDRMDKI